MRNMKIFLVVMILGLATILAACGNSNSESSSGGGSSEYPQFITIGGATSGGTFFLLANAMAQLIGEEFPEIDANAQSTPGSPVILENIQKGNAEMGVAQAGVAKEAYEGTGQFEGNQMDKITQITYLFPNVMQFAVRKDAGIKSVEDFVGKRIAVGASGSATEINAQELLQVADITYEDITPEYTSESQSVELLRNRQADGANMIASLGSSNMLDLMSSGDFEILEFDEEIVKKLAEEVNIAYYPFTIPADTYPNQPEPVETFAVANWLHGSSEMSEDFVYEFLTVLYENKQDLVDIHIAAENINLENALDGKTIPLHPGAIKYFEEQGLEIDE